MTERHLWDTEYCNKLTDDERRIYCASQEQLAAIDTWNDCDVRAFVEVARLLNELRRLAGLPLSRLDECDTLYRYLSELKMNRFDELRDTFDIATLIDTLV